MLELSVINPSTGQVYLKRQLATKEEALSKVDASYRAFTQWQHVPLTDRINYITKALSYFEQHKEEIGKEISLMMGRPIRYSKGEVNGLIDRSRHMASIAVQALAENDVSDKAQPQFKRYMKRVPLGVILVIPAWNYPYLTMVNGVIPALLAGNTVVVKHAPQTILCAERFAEAFKFAGLPSDVYQFCHMDHDVCRYVIDHPRVAYVNFTGSVAGGKAIHQACSTRLIQCGLELGGKDPGYVREDADLDYAVENLVDGAFFNSGQCCCGIERIYVHASLYDAFVKKFAEVTRKYRLGDASDPETTLGPMVRVGLAETVRAHIDDALKKGATALIDEKLFPASKKGSTFVAPQVLVNVNHSMLVMNEETFGPVVGIMKVQSDEEAVKLMNDSQYGLTASIWTKDQQAAMRIGDQLETGTVFMNRCDYVDPGLAWTGCKNTGFGCTLSEYGFLQLTRPKSYHLKQI
jgi:acyl-CoA reductase-like NAD-dependent aldehyde dehydrogenase